jgi:hypothetical protein
MEMSECRHDWKDITREVKKPRLFLCSNCKLQQLRGRFGDLVIEAERYLGIPGMTWTTEKPTGPGLYWFRFGPIDEPVMFCIFVRAGTQGGELWVRHVLPLISEKPVSYYDGQWAGPLEPPE